MASDVSTILVVTCVLVLFEALSQDLDARCPARCHCKPTSVHCTKPTLEYVPYMEALDNTPHLINLSGTNIMAIEDTDFAFEKCTLVHELFLNQSNLNQIATDAFKPLTSLKLLFLNDNLLNSVPDSVVMHNKELVLLDISGNYFGELPTLISSSLEVLIANDADIGVVPKNALDHLPNLRVLHINENNIRRLNLAVFERTPNLFFLHLTNNPWSCNCKLLKLFDTLISRKLVEIQRSQIQCQLPNRDFIQVFNDTQPNTYFQQFCMNGQNDDVEQLILKEHLRISDFEGFQDDQYNNNSNNSNYNTNNLSLETFNYYNLLFLCISVPLSFLMGIVLGAYITYRSMMKSFERHSTINNMNCNKNLLSS